ncbi:hypothetical protein [Rheinheimera sp. 4Y26]|uniref:hypothetical protein n=1 Tax=Rheinheimera sp. 4Y26 TaxID=2977811 RepID=UPI0021B14A93|nr:hypothetical protein [Rheinheimera sp. 4Y26]MCT6700780.1 hypothetical protein [Rheinheimera sp. 4Y26]
MFAIDSSAISHKKPRQLCAIPMSRELQFFLDITDFFFFIDAVVILPKAFKSKDCPPIRMLMITIDTPEAFNKAVQQFLR